MACSLVRSEVRSLISEPISTRSPSETLISSRFERIRSSLCLFLDVLVCKVPVELVANDRSAWDLPGLKAIAAIPRAINPKPRYL
ncbi:MAG: hypothetical protein QNJ72_40790 [Pleurocapsa sp. MO_226.B13]|nr:hypothetical protein [Pleurocapsa sp. MO_226.B13]